MKNTLQNIFWIASIVVVIIIGANHAFSIYTNKKVSETILELDNSMGKAYNDGVKHGWEIGLLRASKIMLIKDQDHSIPFNLSIDSTAYADLLYKIKTK